MIRFLYIYLIAFVISIAAPAAQSQTVLKALPEEFVAEWPIERSDDYQRATNFPLNTEAPARIPLLTRVWRDLAEKKRRVNLLTATDAQLPQIAALLLDYDAFFSKLANHRPEGLSPELERREREETKKLLNDVHRRLQGAQTTKAIADYDVLVTLWLSHATFGNSSAILRSLARHDQVFGSNVRHVPLWRAASAAEKSTQAKGQLLRGYLAAARAMHEPRVVLDAQLLLAQHLGTEARHAEAAALVVDALPAFEEVVSADFNDGSAFAKGILDTFDLNRSDIQKALQRTELERFDRAHALASARYMNFQTDALGTALMMFPVLDLKFRDRELFHRALEVAHVNHMGVGNGCDDTKFPAACIAGVGASVAETIGGFDAALEFQRTRIELLQKASAPAEEVSKALIDLANLELKRGLPRRAQATLDDLPKAAVLDQRYLAIRYFLEAALAYLRLDDSSGAELEAKATQAQIEGEIFDMSPYNVPERRPQAEDLTRVRNATKAIGPDDYMKRPALEENYLELVELMRGGFVRDVEVDAAAHNILEGDPRYAERVRQIQRSMGQRYSSIAAMEIISLASAITSDPFSTSVEVQFLLEPKIESKRTLATALLTRLYQDNYAQFGSDPRFFADMVRFSSKAVRAGYTMAAQVMLEKMFEVALPADQGDGNGWQGRLQVEMADTFLAAYSMLATLQIKRGEFEAARGSLGKADEIARSKIEQGWQIGSDQLMQSFRQIAPSLRRVAQARIDLLLNGKDSNPAAAEAAFKGMQFATLSELSLASHSAIKRRATEALGDPEALARRDAVQEEIRHLEGLLGSFPFNFVLKAQFADKKQKLQDAAKTIAAALPQAELFSDIEAVSIADVRGALNGDEVFLQLHVGATAIYGILIPPSGAPIFWQSAIATQDLEKQITALRSGATLSPDGYGRFSVPLASQLYKTLFGKVDARLKNAKRLVITTEGPLQSLPFATLVTSLPSKVPATESEFRAAKVEWLIRRHSLAQAPSARTFVQQRRSTSLARSNGRFVGIGNPIFGTQVPETVALPLYTSALSSRGLFDDKLFAHLPQLPETEVEINAIAKMFGPDASTLLVGAGATEKAVKVTDFRSATIVAIATHGLMAGEAKGASEPGLVLTRPETQTTEDDGLLTASEILALKFNAELVILSACNTAASDGRPRAEGLSGLAKAFFAAGARGILVTHLPIPSEAAVAISTGMIKARQLELDLDWAQALQRAAIALMDSESAPADVAHPANWGAYALVGAAPAN